MGRKRGSVALEVTASDATAALSLLILFHIHLKLGAVGCIISDTGWNYISHWDPQKNAWIGALF